MKRKTTIDEQRESAISMEIGGDDESPISDFLSTANALYVIKAKGVHKVQLADDIDPGRTNSKIPNLSQQVLGAGSDNPIVATLLLTATTLFDTKNAQVDDFVSNLFEKSLFLTRHLIEIDQAISDLGAEIDGKQAEFATKSMPSRAFSLPSVLGLDTRTHNILVRADKSKDAILDLFRVRFLPEVQDSRQLDILDSVIREAVKSEIHLIDSWTGMYEYFDLVRNMRNASEHPDRVKRVNVSNFAMQPDGSVTPPLIDIQHPKTPIRPLSVTEFLAFVTTSLLEHAEAALAFIKIASLLSQNPFGETVAAFPPEQRRNQHVRFYRAISLGGELRILG